MVVDLCLSSLACKKSKASRQTFVIHTLEKDNLFPNQKVQETTSEDQGVLKMNFKQLIFPAKVIQSYVMMRPKICLI